MNKVEKEVVKRIGIYTKAFFEKVDNKDFVLGDCMYNQRCHLNSIQKLKEKKAEAVYSCIAISKFDKRSYIHFINRLKNGKYQDNTWGWCVEEYDYYLVKRLSNDEIDNIGDYFTVFRDTMIGINSTKWEQRKINFEDLI